MDPAVQAAWIAQLPALIAVVLLLIVVLANWRRLGALLDRVRRVGVGGVELELATQDLKKPPPGKPPVGAKEADEIERRYTDASAALALTRVLWVDDCPANNAPERRFLRAAGVTVVNALTTTDALAQLSLDDFDIVITDQRRPESPEAGSELARQVANDHPGISVIGYVGVQPPTTPDDFLGVTTRPGTLLRLVLDAVQHRG